MKRTALFLAAILILSILCFASCDKLGQICPHIDSKKDGVCDLCGGNIGGEQTCQHADENKNHFCDICGEAVLACTDENKDHNCDYCGVALGKCSDADDDHKCDVCGTALSECKDENKDHVCDYCGKTLSECADADKDHNCDYCGKTLSECADADKDHNCDYCGKTLSECADADKDHNCDYCGKALSECADADKDHNCDYCGKALSECADADKDHNCDYCGKTLSECSDENEDHVCDYCENCIHEYEENTWYHPELVQATCVAPGVAVFECMYCDDYYTEETAIDPEGHNFLDYECESEVISLPDCSTQTNGVTRVKCLYCDATYDQEDSYYFAHSWDVTVNTPATCTVDGAYSATCSLCGEIEAYDRPAEGHYSVGISCGQSGVCEACGEEFTLEHNTVWSPATCTQSAYCMNCWSYVGEPLGHIDEDGDYICDRCFEECLPDHLERVDYEFNVSDLEAQKLDKDLINGKFTIVSGSEIRNRTKTFEGVEYQRSVKIGNKTTLIKVNVPGSGKLTFLVQNGSSGAATQFITVTAPDGTVYDIEFAGTDEGSPVVKIEIDVTEGEWIISRGKNGGTQDVFALSLSCIVEKSDENGFEIVTEGTVDYLAGQTIDLSGLVINAIFANGKTEPLSLDDVTVDYSAVDFTSAGYYTVTVSYKSYDPITYAVNVYLPESITFGIDATVQKGQSSAGNGLYINQSLKEAYGVGETLDLTGLTVIVNGALDGKTLSLNVGNNYTISDVDLSTAGKKTLTITYSFCESKVEASFDIHVVDTEPSIVNDTYMVKVDKSYDGAIGAVVDGYNMFTTLQQALDFLAKADLGKMKVIEIAEGLYTEKLEITIPNLHIKGAGRSKVTIEWNSIYGIKDAGGFSQVTDSTQTVAIRDTAYNVTIEGVTISNYWNSQERMNEAGLEIERGLALLVQADRFIMKNSALLGIQDTLELFTGRQYFENVFISGYTDFIFGTNNTTLFRNCTIHVIDTVKDDNGTAGYLTAFKGSNKGANDAITYGAIFYQCDFTADDGVSAGKTAIGRTWGAYAAVAVIESKLGGHISTDGYDSSNNKNKRYISMNGIHPTDETVQFVEYGNTGAGAITEAVAGMKMLTAEEAALYVDFDVIFGKTNRNVTYLDAWDPEITDVAEDDRTYYYFDQTTGASGTSNTFDITTTIAKGSTLEWAGLLISAENGNVAWNSNANALNMKAGAFIKFTVPAGTEVTVITYPNYNFFTLNGVGTSNSQMLSQYYDVETEVILLSTGDLYIYQIIINPDEMAPNAPTLTEIKVSGLKTNYNVGEEFSLDGVVVKAYYSDNSVRVITDYTVNSDAVVSTAAGEYSVVFTYGEKSAAVTVTYEGESEGPEISKDTYLDFSSADGYAAVVSNPKVTLDGNFRDNGSEHQVKGTVSFPVKAGTLVTVIPYGNSQYVAYTIGALGESNLVTLNAEGTYFATEDCTVVYTGLDNNYLKGIRITCPLKEGKYVFGGSPEEGDFTGILESIPGLNIVGTCKNHSGGAQIGSDTVITFAVPKGASVVIKGYDTDYGQLTVSASGTLIAMDANACYVFEASEGTLVEIRAVNVGTEEAPAWNKSYITYINVTYPEVEEEKPEATEWVFDSTLDHEATAEGDKADGETETLGTDGFFTIHYSSKSKYDGSNKDFEDGYSATQRLSMGGKTSISSTIKNAIEFTTKTPTTVTIWWVCGGDGREIDLYDEGGNIIATTAESCTKNSLYISTFEIKGAGKYYIGSSTGSNYYFKVEVKVAEPTEWVFDSTLDHDAMEEATMTDGATETLGSDGFFTIHYSSKSKYDSSNKDFSDGYSAAQRLSMGGKTVMDGTIKNAIEFTTKTPTTVTIWWVCGGDGREIDLYDEGGNIIATTAESCTKNSLYISSFEIKDAGKYYIGSSVGSNYYFKVEVKVAEASEEPETPAGDGKTYYYFNGQTESTGTTHTYDQSIEGTTGTFGGITVDATTGKVAARDSDTQINAGAKLIFNVEAGTLVTITSYPGYGHYSLNGVDNTENEVLSVYFAEASEVVLEATATAYLYHIVIDPNAEAPADPETPTDPETPVEPETPAGDGKTYYYFNGQTESTGTTHTYDQSIEGTTGTFGGITVDATTGKVAARGSDTQVNAGAKLIFNVEAGTLVTITSYPGYGHYSLNGVANTENEALSIYFAEAGEVVLEATATAYLYHIVIDPNAEAPAGPETPEEPETPATGSSVINFSELETFPKETYKDGDVVKYNDVFTFRHGKNSRIDGNEKTFSDGFEATQRFGFGGKYGTVDGAPAKALEITATGACTVTIWWAPGKDGRSVDLLDSTLEVIATSGTEVLASELYITTFEIPAAGTYYLTNKVDNNYWFKVEVKTA